MRTDIYQQVTDRIISQLEQGVIPWKSPCFARAGLPRNFATGKAYRGINVFLLGSLRFVSPYFLTFIQAKELGGFVRKGEHGHLVIKCGTYTKQGEDGGANGEEAEEKRGYLKAYTVFHASQVDGIEFPAPEPLLELSLTEKTDRAREIIAGMPHPPAFREGSAVPCYLPSADCIQMPERGYFHSEEAYYSTLFHELSHAAGHLSRLARKSLLENKGIMAGGTARKIYAEEELVAEMGASFLNAHAGIVEEELANSAAYLQCWIDALKTKDAKGWIIRAAAGAQKAADYILNLPPDAAS